MLKKKRGEVKPVQQPTLNPLEQQINKASIDEAIAMSQTMGVQEFVALVDHMVFRVSIKNKYTLRKLIFTLLIDHRFPEITCSYHE